MSWLTWPFRCIGFFLWFSKEMVTSSAAVLKDNLTPGQNSTPASRRSTVSAATITKSRCSRLTWTPGTLTLGLNADSKVSQADVAGLSPAKTGPLTTYVHSL